jgi:hypothetical protein
VKREKEACEQSSGEVRVGCAWIRSGEWNFFLEVRPRCRSERGVSGSREVGRETGERGNSEL